MSEPMTRRPAVFLDRDGTLTQPRHYPKSPADLVLQPGVGGPLRALQHMGVALVLVTNQSGLARGFFAAGDLTSMHEHLQERLAVEGVRLDGIYVCPHHPAGRVLSLAVRCRCRKPEAGLLLRAAQELNLDLERSWMVGDLITDVRAGRRAGCRTAWVGSAAMGAEGQQESPAESDLCTQNTETALWLIVRAILDST